jgi:hypothetical protein
MLRATTAAALSAVFASLLLAGPVAAQQVVVSPIAPASEATLRLSNKPRDPNVEAAVRRARLDPDPDASTFALLESVRIQEDHAWQQAFERDIEKAGRAAGARSVPYEYPPNPSSMPDGWGITQGLANAVLRAKLPCGSITAVGSIGDGKRGWFLSCDQGAHGYAIALVGKEWKLGAKR